MPLINKLIDNNIKDFFLCIIDRKLIKAIFMPLIYGKTIISFTYDIRLKFGSLLTKKESYNLATLIYNFWLLKFPDIKNIMKLISLISGYCRLQKPIKVFEG